MEWILFDKDGTLIEFDSSWEKIGVKLVDALLTTFPVYNKETALRQLGIVNDKINPKSVMGSGSLQQMIEAFNQITGTDTSEWTKKESQQLVDQRVPEINWIDGVYDAIKDLRRQGYKIGIVTSDTKKGVEQFLKETNSEDAFDIVISTETHAHEKPDPKVLAPLFDCYDVSPQDVAIVGDTANDIKTAVNAQLGLAVGVLTGIASREELSEADIIIDSAKDIAQALESKANNN